MQKLRDLYKESQRFSINNPHKLTLQRCRKLLALANKHYEDMVTRDDYSHLDEVVFYRDKFKQVSDELEAAAEAGVEEETTQQRVAAILTASPPQVKAEVTGYISPVNNKRDDSKRETSQEAISNFFDIKKQEI
jgi:hypothetical protein